ncbi:nacht and wd domain protein [Colletotrichum musicola]|uniref:Nacht and wd domain protein n=1 Tax=Colletotrichum musicola TaxID=2175873 RepID=A0A8H6J3N3_9PEZI|nr:nacht and wd domain protein [Colletotrichum musicola]
MVMFSPLVFDKMGSITTNKSGGIDIGPMYDWLHDDVKVGASGGPFDSETAFWEENQTLDSGDNVWAKGKTKVMGAIMACYMQRNTEREQPGFVLCPPDFNYQNIMVDEEGDITGLIDWDLAHIVPRVDSPETLGRYRDFYAEQMGEALAWQGDWALAKNAHIAEVVWTAALIPMNRCYICAKFIQHCLGNHVNGIRVLHDIGDDEYEEEDWSKLQNALESLVSMGEKREFSLPRFHRFFERTTQGNQYNNHGSGSQYVASGNQNINTGSGSQYNAGIINFNSAQDSDASLLNDLYVTDPTADKIRIERTKGGILRDSYSWILGHPDFRRWQTDAGSRLLWVKGDPGKGKTMLLCGIIDELEKQKKEPVFFFCQATDGRINTANAVVRGLLHMLLKRRPSLLVHVREEYKHAGKQLFEDANAWDTMCRILARMLAETGHQLDNIIFLIDGLDECTKGLDELLNFIVKISSTSTKIIVSSRNWSSIGEAMDAAEQKVPIWLELNDDAISAAVLNYIKHKVEELAQKKKYDETLRDEVQQYLASNSNNTFLWVSLVSQQLDKVAKRHARTSLSKMPRDLNALYDRMLNQMLESDDAVACKEILAVVSVAYRPVSLVELVSLTTSLEDFSDDKDSMKDIIGECGSLVTLGPEDDIIYIVHQSAKDFLTEHARRIIMPHGISYQHRLLLSRSLEVMSKTLDYDIYQLESPGTLIEEIAIPTPDPLEPIRYACLNWTRHAEDGDPSLAEYRQVYSFLTEHYLHWLEAMSLLKSIYECIDCLSQLKSINQSFAVPLELQRLVNDAVRGLLALGMKTFLDGLNKLRIWNLTTDQCLEIVAEREEEIRGLRFSPTGNLLASHSRNGLIRVRQAETWNVVQILSASGYDNVKNVVFSNDNRYFALGHHDGTIFLWEFRTARLLWRVGDGHHHSIDPVCVAFCPNGAEIMSAHADHTVKFWDLMTGSCLRTIVLGEAKDMEPSTAMVFSADLTKLASSSGVIKIWDLVSVSPPATTGWGMDLILSLAYSSEGNRLVSVSQGGIKLWNAETGQHLQTFCHSTEIHASDITSVTFSGGIVLLATTASLLSDYPSRRYLTLQNMTNGTLLQTLSAEDEISAISFSADSSLLAMAFAHTENVKIWDIAAGQWRTKLALDLTHPDGFHCHYFNFSGIRPQRHLVVEAIENDRNGPATISLTRPSKPLRIPGFSVQTDAAWIKKNGKNILWLPPDYRTYVFANRGQSMALGLESGRILFLRFA